MRRKAFTILIILVTGIFFLDSFSVSLSKNAHSEFDGLDSTFIGKVHEVSVNSSGVLKLRVSLLNCDKKDVLLSCKKYRADYWEFAEATIKFNCKLSVASPPRNPRTFDYKKYLLSRGITYTCEAENVEIVSEKRSYKKWLTEKRERFMRLVLMPGLLFGDTALIDEETYKEFRTNGTAHILAVSGLHVGIIYAIFKLLTKDRLNVFTVLGLIFLLFSYGYMSKWSDSSIRAVSMILMKIYARLRDRRYDRLTALSVVGIGMIVRNPYVVFGASFQMSFLAVVSMDLIPKVLPKRTPETFVIPVSIAIGLSVYQIDNYNIFSLISVLANVPVVFLAGIIVPAAFGAFAVYLMFGEYTILRCLLKPLNFAMNVLISVNKLFNLNGHSYAEIPSFGASATALLIFGLFALISEYNLIARIRESKRKMAVVTLSIAIVFCVGMVYDRSPITHDDVIFIDVGQGDSIHIQSGLNDVLIDGGGNYMKNIGEDVLKEYLLKNGNWNVDVAIATHLDMDHYKGLTELNDCYKVKQMLSGLSTGKNVKAGKNIEIETIWPLEIVGSQDSNSLCSVFIVHMNGYKLMMTGDLDSEGERAMISYYQGTDKLDCDVLKVGHHGSKTSTSQEFLTAVSPSLAIICVGKNSYGHPAPETLKRLETFGIRYYTTLDNGAIGLRLKSGGIKVHTML